MRKKKRSQQGTDITKPYEPTPEECAAWEAVRGRRRNAPRVKVSQEKGVVNLSLDHPDVSYGWYLLADALGTSEIAFSGEIVTQLGKAATQGQKVDERALNFMVSVIKGVQPKDQLETMLAAQMAAVHILTMEFAHRLNNATNIPHQESAERALNKLARTFAAQVEALKRYRTGGEQKVTVQHVSVSDGGQAIVGNVSHGGPGVGEKRESTS
jgi:hypothetical protein